VLAYILSVLLVFSFSCAQLYAVEVVVNKSVTTHKNNAEDIRAIFTLKKRVWADGKTIQVYTLADDNPVHVSFVKHVLRMLPYHIRRIWDRMTFSGMGNPPIELNSEQEMIQRISSTPDSIGYLTVTPKSDDIHALNYQ
jgi:ABC-type phosphate transport system substrate-binding protein